MLWEAFKMKRLDGFKFRRQHPVNRYILDFYCHKVKLDIELDGGYHETKSQKINDTDRSNNLKDLGIIEIRFKNEDVVNKLPEILNEIRTYLKPEGAK